MAEGRDSQAQVNRGIFVGGRARALLNAMTYFKNERMRRGRAGRALDLGVNNNRGVTRQEVGPPCGRSHTLNTLVPGLWCLGGAEASLFQHPPHLHQCHLNL